MSNSHVVLFKLLRNAIGWDDNNSLPNGIYWEEIIDIAYKHGVLCVLLDGYQKILSHNTNFIDIFTLEENSKLKFKCLNYIYKTEKNYLRHINSILNLSEILQDIPFLIMKGFSCSQYYPIPKHRECGDIDIYTGNRFSESEDRLYSYGSNYNNKYYRHSAVNIHGVTIENHKILCDLRGPIKQTREFEKLLSSIADNCINIGRNIELENKQIRNAVYSSSDFNLLFLPWHTSAHFAFERISIRQLLDWALFLYNNGKQLDINLYNMARSKFTFGYSKMVDILTYLSIKYLHLPKKQIHPVMYNNAMNIEHSLAEKVYDNIFMGTPKIRSNRIWILRFNNIKAIWKDRWKYKDIYGVNVFVFILYKVFGVIFSIGRD